MMPTKDLRSAAGKAAWLGSILPRAKWCVAVLYCVLKSVENDEFAGQGKLQGHSIAKGINGLRKASLP